MVGTESKDSKGLKLRLFHGRMRVDEQLDNWGFDGPVLTGVLFVHGTYMSTLTVGFETAEAAQKAASATGWKCFDEEYVLEVQFDGDLVKTVDAEGVARYYGDFELNFL